MLRNNLLTAANKYSDIFLRIIHIICKIQSTLRYFSYIYISYQMYRTRNCRTFYHSLNRFPQGNDNLVSASLKWFNMEVYTRYTLFRILNCTFLTFPDCYEKNHCKLKEVRKKICWKNLKMFRKKTKNFQSHLSRFRSFDT